ncbi:MAG: M55 family metallopeptidase [Acidobacteria bacterium]|nr:M55 family metallopeptidase [Acidobacteriota bacterium]MBI3280171.1 M55 family metallopeptidase [Acidobacteriota bacterium]
MVQDAGVANRPELAGTRRLLHVCLLAMSFGLALPAQTQSRVLIVTDVEGVGGVNNAEEQLLPGQRRFEESKRLLTGETNAAVEGALAAGAVEVVIWDGHDGSRTLSIDEIHPAAKLIQGRPTPANYYLSERRYDGILFVGQHAMSGAKDGVLAHSQSFSVAQITLNGKPVGEIGQVAAIAGHFGIPVIMLAGDQAACDELLALQPKAKTVAVKWLAGKASTQSLSHAEATKRIRQAAHDAVRSRSSYSPWKVSAPVELRFDYKPDPKAPPGTPARVRVYKGATVLEAYEQWLGQ